MIFKENLFRLLSIYGEYTNISSALNREMVAEKYGVDYRSASIGTGIRRLKDMHLIEGKYGYYSISNKGRTVLEMMHDINLLCGVSE